MGNALEIFSRCCVARNYDSKNFIRKFLRNFCLTLYDWLKFNMLMHDWSYDLTCCIKVLNWDLLHSMQLQQLRYIEFIAIGNKMFTAYDWLKFSISTPHLYYMIQHVASKCWIGTCCSISALCYIEFIVDENKLLTPHDRLKFSISIPHVDRLRRKRTTRAFSCLFALTSKVDHAKYSSDC